MIVIVAPGDTLSGLARRHLGNGLLWREIWDHNRGTIIAEQRRRGLAPSSPEDWIFPGTRLLLATTTDT